MRLPCVRAGVQLASFRLVTGMVTGVLCDSGDLSSATAVRCDAGQWDAVILENDVSLHVRLVVTAAFHKSPLRCSVLYPVLSDPACQGLIPPQKAFWCVAWWGASAQLATDAGRPAVRRATGWRG